MVTQRNNINIHLSTTNGINQTILIIYTTTPLAAGSFQCFWFAKTREWMQQNIFKQRSDAFKYACISLFFPLIQVVFSLWKQYYFHISSSFTTRPRPFLMSSSPWRRISTIFGDDMIYSVSSIARFWAVIFLRAFMAFFIMPSSSEMILNSRNNSAFNCSDVITQLFDFCCKNTTNN